MFVAPRPQLDGWAPIIFEIFSRGTKENTPHFFLLLRPKVTLQCKTERIGKDMQIVENSFSWTLPTPYLPLPGWWRTSKLGNGRRVRRGSKRLKCRVWQGNWALQQTLLTVPWYPSSSFFLTLRTPILFWCHFPSLLCSKARPGDKVPANQIWAKVC